MNVEEENNEIIFEGIIYFQGQEIEVKVDLNKLSQDDLLKIVEYLQTKIK